MLSHRDAETDSVRLLVWMWYAATKSRESAADRPSDMNRLSPPRRTCSVIVK